MVITGNPNPIEKIEAIDIEPNFRSYTLGIEGAKPFVLEMVNFYAAIGVTSLSYRANGAIAKITCRVAGGSPLGGAEVPIDKISLKTSELSQSLWLNAKYASLHPAVVKMIRQRIADGEEYASAVANLTDDANHYGSSQGLTLELYDWLLRGHDSFVSFQQTITRTRTVSPRFDRKLAESEVGYLFTPDQLVKYLGGNTIPFTVPTQTLTADEQTMGLIVAWQKFMCDCDDTAGGQSTLVEAWRLAKWSPHYPVKA